MKPFNLEEAKEGKPVCTRDGREARIVCFDRLNNNQRPITYLVKDEFGVEIVCSCKEDGCFSHKGNDDPFDLMMVTGKRKGWVNVYKNSVDNYSGVIYFTEEEAIAKKYVGCVATTMIEWGE